MGGKIPDLTDAATVVLNRSRNSGDPPNTGFGRTYYWDQQGIPLLWTVPILFLEVPDNVLTLDRFDLEVAEAVELGATVVWLVTEQSAPDALQKLVVSPVHKQREPSPLPDGSAVNSDFASYFDKLPILFTFQLPKQATSLARVSTSERMSVAYSDDSRHPGLIVVLPAVAGSGGDHFAFREELAAGLDQLRHAKSPWQKAVTSLSSALVSLALIVATLTVGRYVSRSFNLDYTTGTGSQYDLKDLERHDVINNFWAGITNPQLAEVLGTQTANFHSIAPRDLSPVISRLARIGVTQRIDEVPKVLNSGTLSGCRTVSALADAYHSTAIASLAAGNVEKARFAAQKHINISYAAPLCAGSDGALTQSQSVLELATSGFIFWPADIQASLVNAVSGGTEEVDEDESITSFPAVSDDNQAAPFVAYYASVQVIAAGGADPDEADGMWVDYLRRFPNSPRADEAMFNRLVISTDKHSVNIGVNLWRQQNEASIQLAEEFIKKFPASYLADDASLLIIRMAAAIDDEARLRTELDRFRETYLSGDAIASLTRRLNWTIPYTDEVLQLRAAVTSAVLEMLAAPRGATVESVATSQLDTSISERTITQMARHLDMPVEEVRKQNSRDAALALFRVALKK